ncbi:EpsG family protein [Serratia sp. L9]|uniref:EpsG family protein n=1 Tax=Serratia sp. L9 TaxID=3423946 RepID=UPI003D66F276
MLWLVVPIIYCAFFSFLPIRNNTSRLLVLISAIFVSVIIAGTRYNSDPDYFSYRQIYQLVPEISRFFSYNLSSIHGEWGYLFFNSIFKTFGLGFFSLLLFFSFLSILLKVIAYNKFVSQDSVLAFLIYLSFNFINSEFIQFRFGFAVGIICFSFHYLYEKKIFQSILLMFIAGFFHVFAFIFIIPIVIWRYYGKIRLFKYTSLYYLSLIFYLIVPFLSINVVFGILESHFSGISLFSRLYNYSNSDMYGGEVNLFSFFALRHIIFATIFYFMMRNNDDEKFEFFYVMYLIGMIFGFMTAGFEILSFRTFKLFDVVEPILLCLALYRLSPGGRFVVRIILILLCVTIYLLSVGKAGVNDYQSWLGFYL